MRLIERLQNLDRRILYILVILVIITPLIIRPSTHPKVVFDEVENAYEVLDNVDSDDLILVSCVWGPGTIAENQPQTEVLMRHMFAKNKKFAVISWDTAGVELTYQLGIRLQEELGKEYGKDWVHLGYHPAYISIIARGMGEDFQKVMIKDYNNTPLSELEITKNIKTHKDIGALIDITPSSTMEVWIAYFCGPYRVPLVYCPTAVMAAEAYPFLESGQVKGMLNGVIGAAQYETLIGREDVATDASATSFALSATHIFILVLIAIGNIGYIATKKDKSGGLK